MKRVRVAIEMDSTFVRMLQANCDLAQLSTKDELTPSQQLTLIILGEARGGHEEQIHAAILPAWRPHVEIVHALRQVTEIPE